MPKELQLGLVHVKVDPNGVIDYIHPIRQQDIVETKYQLVQEYASLFRYSKDEEDFGKPVYSILSTQYIHEIMLVYKSLLTLKAFQQRGYRITPPEYYRIMPAVLQQTQPEPPSFVHQLDRGPDRPKAWVAPWYRYYLTWKNNPPSYKLLIRNLEKDPYTVNWIPMINHHARQSDAFVHYGFLSDWYNHIPDIQPQSPALPSECRDGCEALIALTASIFAKTDVTIPDFMIQYIRNFIHTTAAKTYWYYEQLSRYPRAYPSLLWTGSGGKSWVRLLRHMVRRHGGTVVGHDHGRFGIGVADYFLDYLVEFDSCDEMVTIDCGLPPKRLQTELVTTREIPMVRSIPMDFSVWRGRSHAKPVETIQTVMVPSTIYFEESHDGDHFMQGITAVDWHARLFAHLSQWGYRIIHKPHPPEWYCSLPVDYFQSYFDLTVETRRFEQVIDHADAFLFDFSQSSILFPLMYSRKPLIYVDFYNNLRPEFYALLARRCRIVKGWYDEDNRVHIDWSELKQAIPESIELVDQWDHR